MIDLTVIPDRLIVTDLQLVTINFNISDVRFHIDVNKHYYFGKYFNIIIRKNGTVNNTQTLYPLRFNGNQLTWNYTPSDIGTFLVNAVLQNEQNIIVASTTFVVEPDNIISKVNTANNINLFIPDNNGLVAPKYITPEEELYNYNKSKVTL